MNQKKNILLHLYEDPDAEGDLRSLLRDADLREEHKALSEAKFRLDHMRSSRPDRAVIERIMAEAAPAAPASAPGRRRGDRPALRKFQPLRRVLIPAVTIAAAVVVAVGLGWFNLLTEKRSMQSNELVAREDVVPPESLLRATPVNPDLTAPRPVSTTDPLLAWDEAETIRNMYRRMENMRPQSPLDWGERSVPLESLPGATPAGSPLHQAGVQRR
jgi:hypothetical protein